LRGVGIGKAEAQRFKGGDNGLIEPPAMAAEVCQSGQVGMGAVAAEPRDGGFAQDDRLGSIGGNGA
jgi:hypothetical protein